MEYTIKKNKSLKSIRISIRENGEVLVTIPHRLPKYFAEKFLESKKEWVEERLQEQINNPRPKKILAHYSLKDFKENKERAYALVNNRILYFNQFYKYEISRVVIRNQKSRWGSCSKKKNLNFNYKLLFLPSPLLDYVIVHELCHLKEMNHGKNFWALVEKQIPDYKERRKLLHLY